VAGSGTTLASTRKIRCGRFGHYLGVHKKNKVVVVLIAQGVRAPKGSISRINMIHSVGVFSPGFVFPCDETRVFIIFAGESKGTAQVECHHVIIAVWVKVAFGIIGADVCPTLRSFRIRFQIPSKLGPIRHADRFSRIAGSKSLTMLIYEDIIIRSAAGIGIDSQRVIIVG
jgi:hypothetical protein